MKDRSFTIPHIIIACAIFWQMPIASADSNSVHSRLAGVYLSRAAGPSMNLSLGTDGSATVTEDPGSGAITLFGHWIDSDGQVAVTFNQAEEPPMVFRPEHDGLHAVTWNHAKWGKVDPPPMKKGFKVKQLYWFAENR